MLARYLARSVLECCHVCVRVLGTKFRPTTEIVDEIVPVLISSPPQKRTFARNLSKNETKNGTSGENVNPIPSPPICTTSSSSGSSIHTGTLTL